VVLVFSGVLIGFISVTFDELFVQSPEREEDTVANRKLAVDTLVQLRKAFRLGRLVESHVRYRAVVEGEVAPPSDDTSEIADIAKDFKIEQVVERILSQSYPTTPEGYTSAREDLVQALLRHNSQAVAGSAGAGFEVGSLVLSSGEVGIITSVDFKQLVGHLHLALDPTFVWPELEDNIAIQLLTLGTKTGDQEPFSLFAQLLVIMFDHLDRDCAASKTVKDFLLTCDVKSPDFVSQARAVVDFSRKLHEKSFEERQGTPLVG
jgi:hypothetical protein